MVKLFKMMREGAENTERSQIRSEGEEWEVVAFVQTPQKESVGRGGVKPSFSKKLTDNMERNFPEGLGMKGAYLA